MKVERTIRHVGRLARIYLTGLTVSTPVLYLMDVVIDALSENKGYVERFLEGPNKDFYVLAPLIPAFALVANEFYESRNRKRRATPIDGFDFNFDEYSTKVYVKRGSLREPFGEIRTEDGVSIFKNRAEDLMCYEPRKGFLSRVRKPRKLEYGEDVRFDEFPFVWFGYGKPEHKFRYDIKIEISDSFLPPDSPSFSKN